MMSAWPLPTASETAWRRHLTPFALEKLNSLETQSCKVRRQSATNCAKTRPGGVMVSRLGRDGVARERGRSPPCKTNPPSPTDRWKLATRREHAAGAYRFSPPSATAVSMRLLRGMFSTDSTTWLQYRGHPPTSPLGSAFHLSQAATLYLRPRTVDPLLRHMPTTDTRDPLAAKEALLPLTERR